MTDYGTGWRETIGTVLIRLLMLAFVFAFAIVAVFVCAYVVHVLMVSAERGWNAYGGAS